MISHSLVRDGTTSMYGLILRNTRARRVLTGKVWACADAMGSVCVQDADDAVFGMERNLNETSTLDCVLHLILPTLPRSLLHLLERVLHNAQLAGRSQWAILRSLA